MTTSIERMNGTPRVITKARVSPSVATVPTSAALGLFAVLGSRPDALAAPAAFQTAVQNSNPVLYYKFNETSGTTAVNYGSLGSTHDGTYNGSITLGVATQSGDTGITFNGSSDFVESAGVAPSSLTAIPHFPPRQSF
jgi:hypothetical protein